MNRMTTADDSAEYPFLRGGGEMGRLTREKDWLQTSLGTPDTWPQSLRTTLGIVLNSKFPKFLFWGAELLCFYNDAYRPSLGNNGKHPDALGKTAAEVWPEIWESLVKPLTTHIRAGGEATWSEDQLVPIYRNGRIEDVYWTFSYSPVFGESGRVAGVLVTCTETTEKVNNLKKLADSKDQLHFAIEAAELGTWDHNPTTGRSSGNQRFREWFGLPKDEKDFPLEQILSVLTESDRQRTIKLVYDSMNPALNGLYENEYTIVHPDTKQKRIIRSKGRVLYPTIFRT